MPTYDYFCQECGYQEEILHKMSEPPFSKCPSCSKDSYQRRPGGGIGLAFKGSGFYINDYARKGSSESSASESKSSGCCPCGKNNNSCSSKT